MTLPAALEAARRVERDVLRRSDDPYPGDHDALTVARALLSLADAKDDLAEMWRPIETFAKPDVPPGDSGPSKSSARVLLYFPDIKPSEVIGCCRATPGYGGVFYEWIDDLGDEVQNSSGAIVPSHWAPMLAEPLPQQQRIEAGTAEDIAAAIEGQP